VKNQKTILGIVVAVAVIILAIVIYKYAMPNSQLETGYMDVTPAEAKALMDNNPNLIVIDVSPAYAEGHLPKAFNFPVGDGTLNATIPILEPEAMYLVYCHVMTASVAGAQKLIDAGFTNVYRLEGEYDAWIEAGYPIE